MLDTNGQHTIELDVFASHETLLDGLLALLGYNKFQQLGVQPHVVSTTVISSASVLISL